MRQEKGKKNNEDLILSAIFIGLIPVAYVFGAYGWMIIFFGAAVLALLIALIKSKN